jgi:hypothetical protein
MSSRRLLGVFLMLHGLAHAGPGVWAAERWPASLITIPWLMATAGFCLAGAALLEREINPRRTARRVLLGALGSFILIAFLRWGWVSFVGLTLSVVLTVFTLRSALFAHRRGRTAKPRVVGAPHRSWVRRSWGVVAQSALAYALLIIATRPWHSTWGSTAAERLAALPGDENMRVRRYRLDHAVTINAPADMVWPWLVQIGQDRGGFYSYDWLERTFGDHIQNADSIIAAWQHRQPGDFVRAAQPDYLGGRFGAMLGWRLTRVDSGRALVLGNWGTFVLHPISPHATRMHIRSLGDGRATLAAIPVAPLGLWLLEPAHFIMERGMLLGIKRRAERMAFDAGEP